MKKFALILMYMITNVIIAQVGIGTEVPDSKSILDITSDTKGILIPRMTETQRDAISPADAQQALMIYNTSEDCFNYWNLIENKWGSICSSLGKAQITCVSYRVAGTYVEGLELTESNRISLTLNVVKPGSYSISGTTSNGYSFYGSGSFLTAGQNTIKLEGQGTPVTAQIDGVTLTINGVEDTTACTPSVTINSSYADYSISCKNSIVSGVYKQGVALGGAGGTQFVKVSVNAASTGSWSIKSNTVDGIYFEGSGEITTTGQQTVTIYGYGIPTSVSNKTLTLTATSSSGETTCQITVVVVIPQKTFLQVGSAPFADVGYYANASGSRALLNKNLNFGVLEESTVKFEKFNYNVLIAPSDAALVAAFNAKPDIALVGYWYTFNVTTAAAAAKYVKAGGVLILMTQNPADMLVFQALYGSTNIASAQDTNPANSAYTIMGINDEITNGPFGDVRGLYWGADVGNTWYISAAGMPSNLIVYSPTNGSTAGATFFRDPSYNVIYNGEGGFLANLNTSTTAYAQGATNTYPIYYPFAIDANYRPQTRQSWSGAVGVENSRLFANIMAWAVKQAEFNGINTK